MENIDNLETSNRFCKDRKKIMKKKDGFFKKLLSAAVAIGVFAAFLANDTAALAAGGPGDHRSHQFQNSVDPANTEDEGYRWRDSFDFTIGGQQIISWEFNNDGLGFGINLNGSNGIHEELSRIINNVPGVPYHKAAAAITIVVRNPTTQSLEAYSEVVCERLLHPLTLQPVGPGMAPAISIPATAEGGNPNMSDCVTIQGNGYSMYYTSTTVPPGVAFVSQNLWNFANGVAPASIGINANIPVLAPGAPGGDYTCCEGQIVARLFDNNHPAGLAPLFPIVIGNLLGRAGGPITANDIVLVVLHIHSHYDPCAKCAKLLAALSLLMNTGAGVPGMPPAPLPHVPPALSANLQAGNARFLIEVSSNDRYTIKVANVRHCSRAEAAGRDANTALPLNIVLGAPIPVAGVNPLAIPNGLAPAGVPAAGNFAFQNTFPPYVVFGRVTPPAGPVIPVPLPAPAACQTALPKPPVW